MDYEQHFKDCGYGLYPHQLKGLEFMKDRERNGTGGILADDVGLGKTIQAIALMYTCPEKYISDLSTRCCATVDRKVECTTTRGSV